ncbi:MAG: toll/interleukin-1 receptor domain-containing protein [Bacteroidota bacterium]
MAYARANEQYQKALYRQLRVLEKSKVVNKIWYDGSIIAGQQWDVEIKKNLAASQIILFLISADFMASDYIMEEEYPKALQQQAEGKATIIPIIVDHCYWEVIPDIHQLQIPNPNEPLSDAPSLSLLLKKIVKAIHQAVQLRKDTVKKIPRKKLSFRHLPKKLLLLQTFKHQQNACPLNPKWSL